MAHSTAKPRLRWFQFRLRTVLILIGLVAAGLAAWRAYDSWPNEELEAKVRAVLRADDPRSASDAYRLLFKTAGADGLAYLKRHRNDSIAIQATWEEVELSVPLKPNQRVQMDRKKLGSFLSFLEERARVQAPKWWAEALLDAQANERYNVYAYPKDGPYHWAGLKLRAPLDTTLTSGDNGRILLHVGKDAVVVPAGVLDRIGWKDNVSALMTPTRCYIAMYDDWGLPFKLTCIDRTSAKLLWQSDVWGTLWWGNVSGQSMMWVSIIEQDDRVVVFGLSGEFHVEAFRSDNGENLFRFSNCY